MLQDSGDRLMLDIERSRREHWRFGAKLVRGAYMYLEKARADELGYPSPVWDSLEQTHANYNRWGVLPPSFALSAVVLHSSHAGCSLRCGSLVCLLSGGPLHTCIPQVLTISMGGSYPCSIMLAREALTPSGKLADSSYLMQVH